MERRSVAEGVKTPPVPRPGTLDELIAWGKQHPRQPETTSRPPWPEINYDQLHQDDFIKKASQPAGLRQRVDEKTAPPESFNLTCEFPSRFGETWADFILELDITWIATNHFDSLKFANGTGQSRLFDSPTGAHTHQFSQTERASLIKRRP